MKQLFLILVTFCSFHTYSQAQAYILDESYKDEDFLAFKLKFVQALLNEDITALKTMISDDIIALKDPSYPGKKGFIQDFLADKKRIHQFCKEALKLISFGFRKAKLDEYEQEKGYTKVFYAPSFHHDLNHCYSGNTQHRRKTLVLGDNVNVREKPTIQSKVIGQVSYSLLEYQDQIDDAWQPEIRKNTNSIPSNKYWYAVKLKNGKIGYIIEDYISANFGIDLRIAKTAKGWKLVAYLIPMGC